MILYFSATGNSKYVARELSVGTGENMVPLKDLIRNKDYELTVPDGENFGVVMPTYWEGLPSILLDYLKLARIDLQGHNHYSYFVATYGCDYGNILSAASKEFGKYGITFDSLYAARFVDNWSPMFNLKNTLRNQCAEENGRRETAQIVNWVSDKAVGHNLPDQMTKAEAERAKRTYDSIRKTGLFKLDSRKCISCGLCAKQCPMEAIAMKDGYPSWVKSTCTLCLGCFHRCPVAAIDYDTSIGNGQYIFQDIELDN